ncbi:MAG: TonB family protein [Gammaproteobacteria bacterium]|nr:TonB family protein [Gammaproteobacteria bacterium]
MSHGERVIWVGAILASLLAHLALLAQWGSHAGTEREAPVQQRTVTHLSFRSVSATLPQPQPVEPPKPAVEANVKPSAPVVEVPPPKKSKRRRVVPPAPPKPVEKPEARLEEPVPEPLPESATSAAASTVSASVLQREAWLQEQQRNEYLRRMMGHIESHKFYPMTARRRGLQAKVKISFELLAGGGIRDLRVTEGHKLLRSAAEEALARALPLPRPPEALATPYAVSFYMAYELM